MIPDKENAMGIAALFVVPAGAGAHGMNYILDTDGAGLMAKNFSGQEWQAFDALPTETVTTLNEGTGEYESVRTITVPLADVVDWTPWTLITVDGAWYYRSDVTGAWETAAVGDEENLDTLPPQKPTDLLPGME